MPLPRVVFADPVFRAKELVGLSAHARVIHSRQSTVPCHQFLGAQASPAGQRTQLSDFGAVAGDVVSLPRLNRVHHGRGIVAELALGDDLHPFTVAPRVPTSYVPLGLPNLDIVALGEIPVADRLVLDAYAERTSDRVWSLTAAALLTALDTGRSLEEFSRFLGNRCHTELPSTVTTLIDDVVGRASRLRDLGMTQLVECAEPALAALIANDRKLRALCRPVGDRHLAIPPEHGTAFRKELQTLGYALR